jgi:predicted nucleic acid-binding protein
MELAEWVHLHVDLTEHVIARATELEQLGLKSFDAMHVACAESANADIFLTTDDKLLKTALRECDNLHVTTANPLSWLTERV